MPYAALPPPPLDAAAAAAVRVRSSRLHHLSPPFVAVFLLPLARQCVVLLYLDDMTAFYFSHLVAKVVQGTSPVQHALGAAILSFFFEDLGFCTTKQNDDLQAANLHQSSNMLSSRRQ